MKYANKELLIIGGTRLLGLSVLKRLSKKGFNITVISRKKIDINNVKFISCDKEIAIKRVAGNKYDLIIDFLSYKIKDINLIRDLIYNNKYIFISSLWVANLNKNRNPIMGINEIDKKLLSSLSLDTQNYIIGKCQVEQIIKNELSKLSQVKILRLPIFYGANDHTGRLDYYVSRILDGNPISLIDKGENKIQIAWTEDLSKVICNGINKIFSFDQIIWEGTPYQGKKMVNFINDISKALRKKVSYIEFKSSYLSKKFPLILQNDPLWNTHSFRVSKYNLYKINNIKPTNQVTWIKKAIKGTNSVKIDKFRKKEVNFFQRFR